jgi:hypothetical protein
LPFWQQAERWSMNATGWLCNMAASTKADRASDLNITPITMVPTLEIRMETSFAYAVMERIDARMFLVASGRLRKPGMIFQV